MYFAGYSCSLWLLVGCNKMLFCIWRLIFWFLEFYLIWITICLSVVFTRNCFEYWWNYLWLLNHKIIIVLFYLYLQKDAHSVRILQLHVPIPSPHVWTCTLL